MRKLIKLDETEQFKKNINVTDFLSPNYIYVPYNNDPIDNKILINHMFEYKNKPHYSSISGKPESIEPKKINNKTVNCLKIQNNFKEKKFKIELEPVDYNNKKIKHILLNCINDEQNITNHLAYLNKYSDEILDTLEYIYKPTKGNIIIAIKTTDISLLKKFTSKLNQYKNIKLILFENQYLIGNNYFLCERININPKETLILNVYELYKLYNNVKFKKTVDTKYITIINYKNKKAYNYNVKLYTKIDEILNYFHINYKNKDVIINGLLTGIKINPEEEIITEKTNAIIIKENNKIISEECINCGKCYEVCPLHINVKSSLDNKIKNKNCIDCGLCSYVCPSKINLRKYLKGDEDE